MFSETAKEKINLAIIAETQQAIEKYGEKYNSLHEGYAVLKEEVEEARDEQVYIRNGFYKVWNGVKVGELKKEDVQQIREHAEQLALEAVQVAAVCNKILNSI